MDIRTYDEDLARHNRSPHGNPPASFKSANETYPTQKELKCASLELAPHHAKKSLAFSIVALPCLTAWWLESSPHSSTPPWISTGPDAECRVPDTKGRLVPEI